MLRLVFDTAALLFQTGSDTKPHSHCPLAKASANFWRNAIYPQGAAWRLTRGETACPSPRTGQNSSAWMVTDQIFTRRLLPDSAWFDGYGFAFMRNRVGWSNEIQESSKPIFLLVRSVAQPGRALALGVKNGFLADFSYDLQSLIQSITTMVLYVIAFIVFAYHWL